MSLVTPLIDKIYCHENGLKHINIVNNEGFSALFVVNTPIFDNSGVAHGVEHGVFRRSLAFENPETLFQLTSLTDAKINASTFADTTYFHCQSQCEYTFYLAVEYLLSGLFSPVFDQEYLNCEVYDGKAKGVIYRELIGVEHSDKHRQLASRTSENNQKINEFFYGGQSRSIGKLSLDDLTAFHQCFYQASNITLVTANADMKKIAQLIAQLPVQVIRAQTSQKYLLKSQVNTPINCPLNKHNKNNQTERYQAKYSTAINSLISAYYLSLNAPTDVDFNNITSHADEALTTSIKPKDSAKGQSGVITPLVILADKFINTVNTQQKPDLDTANKAKVKLASQVQLPKLFSALCCEAKRLLALHDSSEKFKDIKALSENELCPKKHKVLHTQTVSIYDHHNALWLATVTKAEQAIATISSYILSAYSAFIARRCHGFCYATQALIIENSAYFAIYSAFDVAPAEQLTTISNSLLTLSEDVHFISESLLLAKIKYSRMYQVSDDNITELSQEDISGYLKSMAVRTKFNKAHSVDI